MQAKSVEMFRLLGEFLAHQSKVIGPEVVTSGPETIGIYPLRGIHVAVASLADERFDTKSEVIIRG